jgi:type I restriction enzyme S subunit
MNKKQFEDCFDDVTNGIAKLKVSSLQQTGAIPVIDQGKRFIGGYTNDRSAQYKGELPCILFGDHTRAMKFLDFSFAVGADGIKVLKANETILIPKFAYYYLKNIKLPETGYDRAYKYLKKVRIPAPSIDFQRKSIILLDKVYSIIESRKKAIHLCDKIINSIFFEMFGDPTFSSRGFQTIKLEKLGTWHSGGTPSRSNIAYFDGNVPWFTSGELNSVYISNSNESISALALKNSSAKIIEKGSLLLGMYDTAALKSSITKVESSCNQAIAFSKLNEKCNPLFVYYSIQLSKDFHLEKRLGARQKNLSLGKIKQIEIPNPEIWLQNLFAEKAESYLKIRGELEEGLESFKSLSYSICEKIFNGKELIHEEAIFEDLLPYLKIKDFSKKPERISYLVNLMNSNTIQNGDNYDLAKNFLFEILESPKFRLAQDYDTESDRVILIIKK